jgi:hypothetical protein
MIQIYSYLHHEINRFDVRLVFVYFRATIYIFASYNNFNNMRHVFLLLTALFLLFTPQAFICADDETPEIILIEEGGSNNGGPTYHAPALIPIGCVYSSSLSSILATFLFDLGYISVELENTTTGEYSQTLVNALAGPMVLPISGTAGQWTITFTLPSGVQYYGEFII